jgi:hypothetical protein
VILEQILVLRIGAEKMKVVALVSGGKDSCYAMQRCIDYGHEVRFCADHGLGLNLNSSIIHEFFTLWARSCSV